VLIGSVSASAVRRNLRARIVSNRSATSRRSVIQARNPARSIHTARPLVMAVAIDARSLGSNAEGLPAAPLAGG
jgi:hypothetical protein